MIDQQLAIESLYKRISEPEFVSQLKPEDRQLIQSTLEHLDQGRLSVCQKIEGKWIHHAWLKQAILLYFKISDCFYFEVGPALSFYDKIPLKKWSAKDFVRVVPPACARFGSHIEKGCVLMPSFINIGARVGAGTMVDSWATVGSAAWIGKNVHLSGGVGIGGVLEPISTRSVVIEDNVFVGSRCVIVEGVLVEQEAVLGAGVMLTASTPVIDVTTAEKKTYRGFIPKQSVVIPGMMDKEFPAGKFSVPCALIIGKRTASTDKKTSLNEVMRLIDGQI